MRRFLAPLFLLALLAAPVFARTSYFISPSGSDSNDGLSSGAPFKSFAHAFAALNHGDELTLLDGTYSAAAGTGYINFDDGSCSTCAEPPSGIDATHPTYVHAQTTGNVTVDGGSRQALFLGRSTAKSSFTYVAAITFEGGGAFYNTYWNTIKTCGFHATPNDASSVLDIGTIDGNWGNTYNLFEDVWVWGQSRLIAANYRADNNVWRRVVVRGDGCNSVDCTGSGNPTVGFTIYNSSFNTVENMMIPNRILGGGEPYADFAEAQHDAGPGVSMGSSEYLGANHYYGVMSKGSEDTGFNFEGDDWQGSTISWLVANAAAIDEGGGCFNFQNSAGNTTSISLTHFLAIRCNGSGEDGVRIADNGTNTGTVRAVIASHSNRFGINSNITPSDTDVFGNGTDDYNQTSCSVGCHTTDPENDTGPSISGKNFTKISAGSTLSGAATDGTDIGPNITKRIGTDGTHYGESGFESPTATDLWPYPNQALIKTQMAASRAQQWADTNFSSATLTAYMTGSDSSGGGGGGGSSAPAASPINLQGITLKGVRIGN